MSKDINNNGFDYVDLGLPSGTLWATMNVGASKPSDYGLYFQWGDTSGYTAEQVGKDKQFDWDDYKFSINGSDTNFSKYTTKGATLNLEDDAANVCMGGDWHIPAPEQIKELCRNTTRKWTTLNGIKGMAFTSKKDASKSIFIPASGDVWAGSKASIGICGIIWLSMLSPGRTYYSWCFCFSSEGLGIYHSSFRCQGFVVRGVIG